MGFPRTIPTTQTVVVSTAEGMHAIAHDRAVPTCGPKSVLVRVRAVALNPTDVKMPARVKKDGLTSGCDFTGEVVAVGDQANVEPESCKLPRTWTVGDRVFGVVYGSNPGQPGWGSFANYVEADSVMLCHMPNTWGWDTAASVGGSVHGSVALCLFGKGNLGLSIDHIEAQVDASASLEVTIKSGEPGKIDQLSQEQLRKVVLVYGGSTACGTMALQLLRQAGYIPITTCSPRNFDLVTAYGAAAVFDYHSEACASEIKKYTRSSLSWTLDCVGNTQSAVLCYGALGRAGGRYVALEKYPDNVAESRKVVKASWVMGPIMFGRELQLTNAYSQPANLEARAFACNWYPLAEKLFRLGRLRSHPVSTVGSDHPCGNEWAKEVVRGLQDLRDGKVSASKLIVHVAV